MATLTITVTVPNAASAYKAVANDFLEALAPQLKRDVARAAGQQANINEESVTVSATFS